MTKMENLVRELYRQGRINFGEAAALIGCVETLYGDTMPIIQREAFAIEYGSRAVEGLATLNSEQEPG